MTSHLSWELGIMESIFGRNTSGRIKTQCGKIVLYKYIDNDNPSCKQCKQWVLESEKMMKLLENKEG